MHAAASAYRIARKFDEDFNLAVWQIVNKSDISCLKNQPDAFPVQYTQLSLGQATKVQL